MPLEAVATAKQLDDTLALSMIDRLNSKDSHDKESVPTLLSSLPADGRKDVLSVMKTWSDKQHQAAPALPILDIASVAAEANKAGGKKESVEKVIAEDLVDRLRAKPGQTAAESSNAMNDVNTMVEMLPWQNRLAVAKDAQQFSKEAHHANPDVPELKVKTINGAGGEEHLFSLSKIDSHLVHSGARTAANYFKHDDVYKNPAAEALLRLDSNKDKFLTEKEAGKELFTQAELNTPANPRQQRFMTQMSQSIIPMFFGHDNIEKLYNDGPFTSGWPFNGYVSLGDLEEYNDSGVHGHMKNKGVFR